MTWHRRADCVGVPTEIFYEHPAQAKRICAGCPVRTECLEDAIITERHVAAPFRFGIRAGLTPTQRSQIITARGLQVTNRNELAPCGTDGGYTRHLRRGETTCVDCRRAHADAAAESKARRRREIGARGPKRKAS